MNFRSFENYKESEWLSMEKEKFEEKFNELENSLDAAFGNPTNEAGMTLYLLTFLLCLVSYFMEII